MSDRSTEAENGALPPATSVIVAVGTDHHPFDRLVGWVDQWSADHPDVTVLVQRGTSSPTTACPSRELLAHPDLCERFAMASAVISHGGPSTVMDARMAGRLPIVVARDPRLGEHVDDHQMRFADHLERHELAVVVSKRTDFIEALDRALAHPEDFVVPIDGTAIGGVIEFGRVLDDLLGTRTVMTPASPAGFDDMEPGPSERVPSRSSARRSPIEDRPSPAPARRRDDPVPTDPLPTGSVVGDESELVGHPGSGNADEDDRTESNETSFEGNRS